MDESRLNRERIVPLMNTRVKLTGTVHPIATTGMPGHRNQIVTPACRQMEYT